jgi:hypothetical protein
MRRQRLYGYPDMGRTGLGHSLLAWARCVVWCEITGATMLAPRWMRLRIGPYLRGERDKREYFKLFKSGGRISGLTRTAILCTATQTKAIDGHFSEDIFSEDFLVQKSGSRRGHVVVFNNAASNNEVKFFSAVWGHSKLLHESFLRIVRAKYIPKVSSQSVAVHVRMGDFSTAQNAEDLLKNNTRLPLDWYIAEVQKLSAKLKPAPAITVYSDGTDDQLEKLLALPNVTRAAKQESVTDLLCMTKSAALVASGSGFSLWASFLGQVPTIYYPGRKRVQAHDDLKLNIENGIQDELPGDFVNRVQANLLRSTQGEPN